MRYTTTALCIGLALLLGACAGQSSTEVSTGSQIGLAVEADGAADDQSGSGSADIEGKDGATDETHEAEAATLQNVLLLQADPSDDRLSSARFEAVIAMTGGPDAEIPGEFALTVSGAYDLEREASSLRIDMSDLARLAGESGGDSDLGFMAAFLGDGIEMITIGEEAWINWALLAMFTGVEDKWLATTVDDSGDMTSDVGVSAALQPNELLDMWADAPATIEEIGVEDVRDGTATHYRVLIDADELARSMSAADWNEFEDDLGVTATGEVALDLWIDDEGLLHRYIMDVTDPSGDEVTAATFSFEVWDHGADVGITPPPAEDVVTEDQMSFGFDTEDVDATD